MNKYPRYYINVDENVAVENKCLWRAGDTGVLIGMNDSPFALSNCTEADLKLANGMQRIPKREAKSLFPNLVK